MLKIKKILLICLSALMLTACSDDSTVSDMIDFAKERYEENQQAEAENPMAGMDKNEKVLFILHESYPEHTFTAVEPAKDGSDSGIYADENGLEFEVHNIWQQASYQIVMDDNYIYETLMEQDFLNKATEITDKHGLEIEFNDFHKSISVNIDISNYQISPEQIFEVVTEILSLPDYVPRYIKLGGGGFSGNEINYNTSPSMNNLHVDLYMGEEKNFSSDTSISITFADLDEYTDEELIEYIEQSYISTLRESDTHLIYSRESYADVAPQTVEDIDENTRRVARDFMSFNVPVELKFHHMTDGYYNPEKTANNFKSTSTKPSGQKNIIDISYGTYSFDISEKEMFKQDIENNIKSQIGDRTDVEFVSIEEYPNSDHIVFKVVLNEPFGATSKHYYIMGDGAFALVEQTTFTEEEYYDEVTAELIESFEWEQIQK